MVVLMWDTIELFQARLTTFSVDDVIKIRLTHQRLYASRRAAALRDKPNPAIWTSIVAATPNPTYPCKSQRDETAELSAF